MSQTATERNPPSEEGRFAFGEYRKSVSLLIAEIPPIYTALRGESSGTCLEGWDSMVARFRAFEDQDGEPVMVATLYGPSGAGKSAWFRQLTGIKVPSGDIMRPTSRACAMAVPKTLDNAESLARLFPGFALTPLKNPEELCRPDASEDHELFYLTYPASEASQPLPLILIDAPDFNTVERKNWEMANRVLDRAEVVVFLVYDEAYTDDKAVSELARCCRRAGFLAYLFTKTRPDAAKAKWDDLLSRVRTNELYAARRQDGRTLSEFLSSSHVYASARSEHQTLTDIVPLDPVSPPLDSVLRGQDAIRVVLSGLVESTSKAAESCVQLLGAAKQRQSELRQGLDQIDFEIDKAALSVAAGQFPAARLLALVAEVSRDHLPPLFRTIHLPLAWTAGQAKGAIKALLQWLKPDGRNEEVKNRETLERERLTGAVESLIDRFRSLFPNETSSHGILEATKCTMARASLLNELLPQPQAQWENVVRAGLVSWCSEHKLTSYMIAATSDLLYLGGISMFVVDLFVTGGFGTLGLAAMAAAGCVAAAKTMNIFERLHLKSIAEEAYEAWRDQRRREIKEHLRLHFSDRLFAQWLACLASLDEAKIGQCESACLNLKSMKTPSGSNP